MRNVSAKEETAFFQQTGQPFLHHSRSWLFFHLIPRGYGLFDSFQYTGLSLSPITHYALRSAAMVVEFSTIPVPAAAYAARRVFPAHDHNPPSATCHELITV